MKLLALDFDGVLCESAPEAFRVALRTWRALHPERPLGEDVYPAFLEMMPLGNRAEDYGVELEALASGRVPADQAEYDALKASLDPVWLRAFHERFYRERAALHDADPEAWYALMRPYPEVLDVLRRRGHEVELAIATSKDRRSVQRLLASWGAAELFGEERILDKETGVSKDAHLEHLHERLGIPCAEMTFVDDKVNHLETTAPLGARCVLAAWGYNGPREHRQAEARGFLVCTLADFEPRVFGAER